MCCLRGACCPLPQCGWLFSSSEVWKRDWLAIVRACYTMENGPNNKNGKKWEKNVKHLPRSNENWKKMAEKYRKNGKLARFSIFSVFFGHFFPFSIGANFPRFPIFFPIFVVRPVFHCVAGPHDCKDWREVVETGPKTQQKIPLNLSVTYLVIIC